MKLVAKKEIGTWPPLEVKLRSCGWCLVPRFSLWYGSRYSVYF